MNYPIPATPEEIFALRELPLDEELIATVVAGIVKIARQQGQSLEELQAEVLQDDSLLDGLQRKWLSNLVTQAWQMIT